MTYAQSMTVNTATLRKQDFKQFQDDVRSSAKLRDAVRQALGMPPMPAPVLGRPYRRPAPRKALTPPPPPMPRGLPVTVSDIIAGIAADMDVAPGEITGSKRAGPVMMARLVAYVVLVRRGSSTPQVGKWIGRDHSSVISGIKRFEKVATPWMRKVAAKWISASEEPA